LKIDGKPAIFGKTLVFPWHFGILEALEYLAGHMAEKEDG